MAKKFLNVFPNQNGLLKEVKYQKSLIELKEVYWTTFDIIKKRS